MEIMLRVLLGGPEFIFIPIIIFYVSEEINCEVFYQNLIVICL